MPTVRQRQITELQQSIPELEALFQQEFAQVDGDDIWTKQERSQIAEVAEQLAQATAYLERLKLAEEAGGAGDETERDKTADGDGAEADPFTPPTEANEPTLRKGDESDDGWVEYLQQLLNKHLGSGTVTVSGKFDQATKKAVEAFQGQAGCKKDGIVGNQTWSALREDKVLAEIGTDGRKPGEFEEKGAEARWAMESGHTFAYTENKDTFMMVAVSVGTEPIKGFPVDILINGERRKTVIGASFKGEGDPNHVVILEEIVARHGNGPFKIEAYLPQELGGDKWEGELEEQRGGGGEDEETFELAATFLNKETKNPPEATVLVELAGGPRGFKPPPRKKLGGDGLFTASVPNGKFVLLASTGEAEENFVVDVDGGDVKKTFHLVEPSDDKPRVVLTATVTNADSGEPIEGIAVSVDEGPKDFVGTSEETGKDGQMALLVPIDAVYKVTVVTDKNKEHRQDVKVGSSDASCTFKIEQAGGGGKRPSQDGGDLTIVVIDKNTKKPLENVAVVFEDVAEGQTTDKDWTDSKGEVFVAAPGGLKIKVTATSANVSDFIELTMPNKDIRKTIALDESGAGGDRFKLISDFFKKGTKDEPLDATVLVEIIGGPDGFEPFREKADVEGRLVAFVPPGKYEIHARTRNEVFKTGRIIKNSDTHEIYHLEEPSSDIVHKVVTIAVKDAGTGNPMKGTSVVIMGDGAKGPKGFTPEGEDTDSGGQVAFLVPEDASYVVSVTKDDVTKEQKVKVEFSEVDVVFEMGASGGEDPAETHKVSVYVYNERTKLPVPDARVTIAAVPPGFKDEAKTNKSGRTAFDAPAGGDYVIDAIVGKEDVSVVAQVRGKDVFKSIGMDETPGVRPDNQVKLAIEVRNKDTGDHLPDVDVSFDDGPEGFANFSHSTDSKGRVEYLVPTGSEFKVTASIADVSKTETVKVADKDATHPIELDLKGAVTNETVTLTVKVVDDASGKPIENASATVSGGPDDFLTEGGDAGKDGIVKIDVPANDDYSVTADFDGESDARTVKVGDKDVEIEIKLKTGGKVAEESHVLKVVVTSTESGDAIEAADVTVSGGSIDGAIGPIETDNNGVAEFKDVKDGDYTVKAVVGKEKNDGKVTIAGKDASLPISVNFVPPPGSTKPVLSVFVMSEGLEERIDGAKVVVEAGADGPAGFKKKEKTTVKGSAEFSHLSAGAYKVTASTPDDSKSRELDYDGAFSHLPFKLDTPLPEDGARLRVEVYGDRSIDPIGGATVHLTGGPKGFKQLPANTDSEGIVEFGALQDGSYTIKVTCEDPKGRQSRKIRIKGEDLREQFEWKEVPGVKGAIMTIEVLQDSDKDDIYIPGVIIKVSGGPSGKSLGKMKTGADGRVVIPGVEEGDYKVTAEWQGEIQNKDVEIFEIIDEPVEFFMKAGPEEKEDA